ncbi:MAG: formate dehydrogenase accessory sulfurtransferase FdhD [Lachnospiraceae bacterium]|nr:formate dehydrogenase accessory sulfurtransferase FdhD [Lachnospiraceae bacterium]
MRSVSMVILAGGKSSRMGRDKADLTLGEKTFLEIQIEKGRALGITDILVSGYKGDRCSVPVVKDRLTDKGPLGGLEVSFRQAKNPMVLVLCVDVPLVPVKELEMLISLAEEKQQAVILRHGDRTEPMMGVFPADLADDMVEEIEKGRGRIFHVLEKRGYSVYETEERDELFRNVNDEESYRNMLNISASMEVNAFIEEVTAIKITASGEQKAITRTVIREQRMDLYVDGQLKNQILCAATNLEELVLGRLLTMGVIHSLEEVNSIRFRDQKTRVHVVLKTEQQLEREKSLNQEQQLHPSNSFTWKLEWIWALEDAFEEEMELHRATKSAHAAFLMKEGKILFRCEDIGRHNALDKAIGFALKNRINLKECILFTSGRVPTDMAEKAVMAGVPVFVSRKTPTADGIRIAKENGILLIGNVRNRSMQIFAGYENLKLAE